MSNKKFFTLYINLIIKKYYNIYSLFCIPFVHTPQVSIIKGIYINERYYKLIIYCSKVKPKNDIYIGEELYITYISYNIINTYTNQHKFIYL